MTRTFWAAAVAVAGLLGSPVSAHAATVGTSTVTIAAEGVDLHGVLKSDRAACMVDRLVIVFKQHGTRGGGDDTRFAHDTTELVDGHGVWSTGNTGTEGRFYARVRKTDSCAGDSSPTIRATR
jgi:hypothetical protein